MNDETTNKDIRDQIESALTNAGYSLREAGHGYWAVTTPGGKTRCVSLRIKQNATYHRKSKQWEYGVPESDWDRLCQINTKMPAAVMVMDKSTGSISFAPIDQLEDRVRLWAGAKLEATVFIPQSALKPIGTVK